MEQLLIVEDDIGLNQGLCKALKADARQIISCQDLKTAKEQLLCGGVSLILLDINPVWKSGVRFLPIHFFSARRSVRSDRCDKILPLHTMVPFCLSSLFLGYE